MKYSFDLEKSLLSKIENEDDGDGLEYVHVGQFEEYDESDVPGHSYPCSNDLFYQIRQMEARGFVKRRLETDDGFHLTLTPVGHDRVMWHKNNTLPRNLARWFGKWVDRALASIVTPIIVAILTVIALEYLELAK